MVRAAAVVLLLVVPDVLVVVVMVISELLSAVLVGLPAVVDVVSGKLAACNALRSGPMIAAPPLPAPSPDAMPARAARRRSPPPGPTPALLLSSLPVVAAAACDLLFDADAYWLGLWRKKTRRGP